MQVFDEGRVNLGPGGLERGHAVGRDGHFAGLYSEGGGGCGGGVGGEVAGAGIVVYLHGSVFDLWVLLSRGFLGFCDDASFGFIESVVGRYRKRHVFSLSGSIGSEGLWPALKGSRSRHFGCWFYSRFWNWEVLSLAAHNQLWSWIAASCKKKDDI